jgi:hypothetical protein
VALLIAAALMLLDQSAVVMAVVLGGFPMDIHGRLMPNMQGEAAAAVDGVLRAAINKRTDDVG